MKSYQQFASDVQNELRQNPEWQDNFKKCISDIGNVAKQKKDSLPKFRVNSPLFCYTTIGNEGKPAYSIKSILRYKGQEVATITPTVGGACVTISNAQATSNRVFFKDGKGEGQLITTIANVSVKWNSAQGKEFRSCFNAHPSKNNSKVEHTLESVLLTELEKKLAKDKSLCGIQPIKLNGKRFQMKTALAASQSKNGKCTYSRNGGGIDILARRKIGNRVYLAVIELKDEYTKNEEPKDAIRQAIAYGVFIRELLRCEDAGGQAWYRLFGFSGELPSSLTIKCAITMPDIENVNLFGHETLALGQDCLELHCISINKTNGTVESCSAGF